MAGIWHHRAVKLASWVRLVAVVGVLGVGVWWLRRVSIRHDKESTYSWVRENPKPDSIANAVRFESDPEIQQMAREDLRADLAVFHEKARAHARQIGVPHPERLDPLLDALLARTDNEIALVVSPPEVDRAAFAQIVDREARPGVTVAEYGDSLEHQAACGNGLSDVFAEVLGPDILTVSNALEPRPLPHVEGAYKVSPGYARYTTKNGRRIFPGVRVTGSLDVVTSAGKLVSLSLDDQAGDSIEFSTDGMLASFEGGSDNDVAYALVRGACKTAGYRLVEKLTGWKRPGAATADPETPASPSQIIAACERDATSAGCLAAGELLRKGADGIAADPTQAIAMYERGCKADGMAAGDACFLWADLASERAAKLPWQQSIDLLTAPRVDTQMACDRDVPKACYARGRLALVHGVDRPVKPFDRVEALDFEVRACMMKIAYACEDASELAMEPGTAETPLWGAAWALMLRTGTWYPGIAEPRLPALQKAAFGKESANVKIRGVELGADRIVDVTWADWLDLDEGHAVYWVVSKSPPDAVRARLADELAAGSARVYTPEEPPYDVRYGLYSDRKSVKTIYGLMSQRPMRIGSDARVCGECAGTGSNRYAMGCRCLPIDTATGPSFKTR